MVLKVRVLAALAEEAGSVPCQFCAVYNVNTLQSACHHNIQCQQMLSETLCLRHKTLDVMNCSVSTIHTHFLLFEKHNRAKWW